ncbi:sporulation protein, partial [Bradyrhizobium japonicum]
PAETMTPQQPADQQQPQEENQNEFFKEITAKKIKEDTFEVKGKAKVFEGVLDYVVEDGHNELAEGSAKASKGAPEWGDFSFTVNVKKDTPNSTLMLILFEKSAKDGKRKGELPIALPEEISK